MENKAFFIAVGSELLSSKSNKYSPLIASRLFELGINLAGEITASDNEKSIMDSIAFASDRAELIIVTGGLGPTFDDLTRQAISKFCKKPLIHSGEIEKFLQKKYKLKNLPENFLNQCLYLKDATLFENNNGTAFGQAIKGNIKGKNRIFILLPGPYREWAPMWDEKIKYFLRKNFSENKVKSAFFGLCDLKEMEVQHKAEEIMKQHPDVSFTVLASAGICEFSFSCSKDIDFLSIRKKLRKTFEGYIYSEHKKTLAEELYKACLSKGLTLSLAESCTGGLVSNLITDVPGSSQFYKGGVNSYSNEAKMKLLGVRGITLEKYGDVSAECATEMADGAAKVFKTDIAISITGIAGPGGGSQQKPVGSVYFAFNVRGKTSSVFRLFKGDRIFIKNSAANFALFNVLKLVK